jgi:hypothetical protein
MALLANSGSDCYVGYPRKLDRRTRHNDRLMTASRAGGHTHRSVGDGKPVRN